MRIPSGTPAKKAYTPPKLNVYGDLAQLTLMNMRMGGNFDNMMLSKKT